MSLKSKLFNAGRQNPFNAYKKASQHGGNTLNAVLDPSEWVLDHGSNSKQDAAKAAAVHSAKQRKKRKKKAYENAAQHGYKAAHGMKKGGQVRIKEHKHGDSCRGMGCATRGGKFGRNG